MHRKGLYLKKRNKYLLEDRDYLDENKDKSINIKIKL